VRAERDAWHNRPPQQTDVCDFEVMLDGVLTLPEPEPGGEVNRVYPIGERRDSTSSALSRPSAGLIMSPILAEIPSGSPSGRFALPRSSHRRLSLKVAALCLLLAVMVGAFLLPRSRATVTPQGNMLARNESWK